MPLWFYIEFGKLDLCITICLDASGSFVVSPGWSVHIFSVSPFLSRDNNSIVLATYTCLFMIKLKA